jgi:spore coat protein U-like protein
MEVLRTIAGSLGGLMLAASSPVSARTATGAIEVSLTVLPGCSVSTTPLAFAARAGSAAEAEAAIDVRCSAETGVAVSLDQGRHATGSQRRLASDAGGSVAYQIYSDAARSQAWNGSPIPGDVRPDSALRLVAYGRIEPRDSRVAVGEYRDSVTVTVAF